MSLASAVAHAHPPLSLPPVPRVRPPPIPKGTPGPNTKPIPSEGGSTGRVWADGEWRDRLSNSAKHKSEIVSRQFEKALRHDIHGMNIYAYKNFKTHQVVYSLTKNMDNNKVLKQLLFHGKQTVPRALRRDMWRPYFSIHFPQTPAGAAKGLVVYRELRELSLRRQLKPPLDMVIATQQDIDNIKKKYTALALKEATERDATKRKEKYIKLVMPIVGMRLPKKMIARRLMNQRATSVADVAAVLRRHIMPRPANKQEKQEGVASQLPLTPKERLDRNEISREERKQGLSSRAFDRLEKIEQAQAKKIEELETRKEYVKHRYGQAYLQRHTKSRLSMEYEGLVYVPERGMVLNLIDEAQDATREEAGAEIALRAALEDIAEEKEAQRDTIEKEVGAQIDQRLSDMDEAQRSHIQQEIQEERADKEKILEAKVAEAEAKLRTDLEELHEKLGGIKTKKDLATYRQFKRQANAEITAMKLDEGRNLKWLGPYAEINGRITEAHAAIDARWAQELAALQERADEEKAKGKDATGHEVEVRWADMRDGTHAHEWPDSVFHGAIQPKAVVKTEKRVIREYAHFDEHEHDISEQRSRAQIPTGNTVHVFGTEEVENPSDARWQSPEYLAEQSIEARRDRVAKWSTTETILMRRRINMLRIENATLKKVFDGSVLDRSRMEWLAWLIDQIDLLNGEAAADLTPEQVALIEADLMDADNLSMARAEVANSPQPDVDRARLDWIKHTAGLIRLERAYPEAKHQADLREKYMAKFDERMEILVEIAKGTLNAGTNLQNFDKKFPLVKELMQKHGVNFDARSGPFDNIERARASQQEALQNAKEWEETARTSLFDAEANHPSIDGKDPEPVREAKKVLEAALAKVNAAEEVIAQTRARRMLIIEEIEQKGNLLRNDKDAWYDFKARGGEDGYWRTRNQEAEQSNSDVVIPEQRDRSGFWGRVKGIFGRS